MGLVNLGLQVLHKGTKNLRLQVLITQLAKKTIDTFAHASTALCSNHTLVEIHKTLVFIVQTASATFRHLVAYKGAANFPSSEHHN